MPPRKKLPISTRSTKLNVQPPFRRIDLPMIDFGGCVIQARSKIYFMLIIMVKGVLLNTLTLIKHR